jgi:RNA polymerase II-associated factor 1
MNRVRRPEPNVDRESPAYIKSQVEKSFEIAATNLENSSLTRHPTNRNLKVVSAHSLIPDLDAFPDAGGYITLKFLTNPVPPSKTYDTRLETGLLRPIAPTAEEAAAKDAAREAHERDPTRFPAPDEGIDYEYFLAESAQDAENFKRKFNVSDPDRDDDELYARKNGSGVGCFRFKRLRAYESASQAGSVYDKYDEEVMIAVHDGSDGLHENAAYYYPLVQRTAIRPQRNKNIQKQKLGFAGAETEETSITDYMDMAIEDPSEDMVALRDAFRDHPLGREGLAELAEQNGEAGEEDGDAKAGSKSPEPKDDDDEKSDS